MFSQRAEEAMKKRCIDLHYAGNVWRASLTGLEAWFQADGATPNEAVEKLIDNPYYRQYEENFASRSSRFLDKNGVKHVRVLSIHCSPLSDDYAQTEVVEATPEEFAVWARNMVRNMETNQSPFFVTADIMTEQEFDALQDRNV